MKGISNKKSSKSLLIPAPDGGNIGDQAMLTAALLGNQQITHVVFEKEINIPKFAASKDSVTAITIPHLVHRFPLFHLKSFYKFAKLTSGFSEICLIGADLMDGKYNYLASLRRLQLLHLANSLGKSNRVYGFSWSETNYNTLVKYLLKNCKGTHLLVRDPVSFDRLAKLGVLNIVQTSDLVFSLPLESNSSEPKPKNSQEYCIINASGLITVSKEGQEIYIKLIDSILKSGIRIVLLPHVIRESDDDLLVLTELCSRYVGINNISLIETLLNPQEIFQLCLGAKFVVTSRMHLSIISLLAGTPPITFSSNGKVAGLMKMFGIDDLCIAENSNDEVIVQKKLRTVMQNSDFYELSIKQKLPQVVELSRLNFNEYLLNE